MSLESVLWLTFRKSIAEVRLTNTREDKLCDEEKSWIQHRIEFILFNLKIVYENNKLSFFCYKHNPI